jgi:hypothetical protein
LSPDPGHRGIDRKGVELHTLSVPKLIDQIWYRVMHEWIVDLPGDILMNRMYWIERRGKVHHRGIGTVVNAISELVD